MSHELRTPLNAVIGFTDVMRTESYGPIANERYKQYLDDISHSSTHLLRVISDLLDFSKIEAGKLEMYREDIAVDELVEGVVAMMRQEAERSRVALRLEKGTPQTILSADPHRLRQVLLNLLSNAIKFTPAAGEVQACTVMQPDGDVSIVVTDTGIGMAEADIEHALEPFGQVEQGLARKYQGTGLGLPLAKRLAELQGATLEIASAPQKGTTVVVTFPAGFVTEYTPSNRNSVRQSVA
jgi:signal transduction histidine kinase